jgi:hypothetical protein
MCVVLWGSWRGSLIQQLQSRSEPLWSEQAKPVMQAAPSFPAPYPEPLLEKNVARVQPLGHVHHGHPGLFVTSLDRRLDWRRATVPGEQRCVQIMGSECVPSATSHQSPAAQGRA